MTAQPEPIGPSLLAEPSAAIDALRAGADAWNAWRRRLEASGGAIPTLRFAKLERASLAEANPADLDLSRARWRDADLRGAKLAGANLAGADLSGARLAGADLTEANLAGADLRDSDLSGARLRDALLSGADLSGALLAKARFANADLARAAMRGASAAKSDFRGASLVEVAAVDADFSGADFLNADLSRAGLERACFAKADLRDAKLDEARLVGANLSEADLSGASLGAANLEGARLVGARLRERAKLRGARLVGANLSLADLSGADFSNANLERAKLEQARAIGADFTSAALRDCAAHGVAAWDAKLEGALQENLVVSPSREPSLATDDLEIGHFLYQAIRNERVRGVFDRLGARLAFAMGRFSPDRLDALQSIREALRAAGWMPVTLDLDKPDAPGFLDCASRVAGIARFAIVDLTGQSELESELSELFARPFTAPIQPIVRLAPTSGDDETTLPMPPQLAASEWSRAPLAYVNAEDLRRLLEREVIPELVRLAGDGAAPVR
jgi:uncharacterized protein YjbI with pentapeptide repeats